MTQEEMNKVAEKLVELRGIKTRTGVAKAVGVSASALQAYERAWRMPKDDAKARIANYYGVTVGWLFYDEK